MKQMAPLTLLLFLVCLSVGAQAPAEDSEDPILGLWVATYSEVIGEPSAFLSVSALGFASLLVVYTDLLESENSFWGVGQLTADDAVVEVRDSLGYERLINLRVRSTRWNRVINLQWSRTVDYFEQFVRPEEIDRVLSVPTQPAQQMDAD
jgi:hypothetical protein